MNGFYHDPLHGHCLRRIDRTSYDTYRIVGVYGDDESPHTNALWTATMRVIEVDGDEIRLRVDFAGKLGKADRFMTASYKDRRLRWIEDGNEWHQLFVHAQQLSTKGRLNARGTCSVRAP